MKIRSLALCAAAIVIPLSASACGVDEADNADARLSGTTIESGDDTRTDGDTTGNGSQTDDDTTAADDTGDTGIDDDSSGDSSGDWSDDWSDDSSDDWSDDSSDDWSDDSSGDPGFGGDSTGNYSESEIVEELVNAGFDKEAAECAAPKLKDADFSEADFEDDAKIAEITAIMTECMGVEMPTD